MSRPDVSFEFFPPRSAPAAAQLWATITALEPLDPGFVSVTYGAGGTTRDQTVATVLRIHSTTRLRAAAHLTCVASTRHEVDHLLDTYWQAGVRRIVALRGDPPGGGAYQPHPEGYRSAAELVAGIRAVGDFEISVAAYPETHPAAPSPEADLDNLKRKLDAGASRAITQYFFDTATYLRFVERARKAGIAAPIVPGIMPVTNFVQLVRFSKMCGTSVPPWLAELFEGLDDDPDTRKLVAAMVATEQCRALAAAGVDSFHFYTLNRSDLILGICRRLGLKPAAAGLKPGLATEPAPPARDPSVP